MKTKTFIMLMSLLLTLFLLVGCKLPAPQVPDETTPTETDEPQTPGETTPEETDEPEIIVSAEELAELKAKFEGFDWLINENVRVSTGNGNYVLPLFGMIYSNTYYKNGEVLCASGLGVSDYLYRLKQSGKKYIPEQVPTLEYSGYLSFDAPFSHTVNDDYTVIKIDNEMEEREITRKDFRNLEAGEYYVVFSTVCERSENSDTVEKTSSMEQYLFRIIVK